MSTFDDMCLSILVSSANIPHSVPIDSVSGKSLTYNIKFNGQRVAPCGMPDITSVQSEYVPFTVTLYFLFDK